MKPWRSFPVPVVHATWRVDLYKEQPICDGERVQGYCDYAKRRIALWMNPNELALRASWWHEFGHALLYELGHEKPSENDTLAEGIAIGVMCVREKVPWF